MFSGDPNKILVQLEPEAKPEDEEAQQQQEQEETKEFDPLASTEEEDESSKIVPVNLKEVDRLHFTVLAIENDCHIMPHGAMRLTEQHEVHRNVAFRGLDKNNAFVLSSYSHFRNVQDSEKKSGLLKDDAIFHKDFLDEVHADAPLGCWSIQKDATGRTAIIRNHMWQGYTHFHQVNSKVYGSVYVGEGIKNADLPFHL